MNVLVNALSRKITTLVTMSAKWKLLEQFRDLNIEVQPKGDPMLLANMVTFEWVIITQIKEK